MLIDASTRAAGLARGAVGVRSAARDAGVAHALCARRAVHVGDTLDTTVGRRFTAGAGCRRICGCTSVGHCLRTASVVVATTRRAGVGRSDAVLTRGAEITRCSTAYTAARGGLARWAFGVPDTVVVRHAAKGNVDDGCVDCGRVDRWDVNRGCVGCGCVDSKVCGCVCGRGVSEVAADDARSVRAAR